MSLCFYIVKGGKICDSIRFANRVSIDLIKTGLNNNQNPLQKLMEICSHDSNSIKTMNSHRLDPGEEERELSNHEEDYEPFNEEWVKKKALIKNKYAELKKISYPKVNEVDVVFKDILSLLIATKGNNESQILSGNIGLDLVDKNEYPIDLLIKDFQNLTQLIETHKNNEYRICWRIM